MALPQFNSEGDLPIGIYPASLAETLDRFGRGSPQRVRVGERLARICALARETGHVARLIVFGSFVTGKTWPNDVDVFLLMDDEFDVGQWAGEVALVFDHDLAQNALGASIFWVRRIGALGGEAETVAHWQIRRDGARRGIVEVIE